MLKKTETDTAVSESCQLNSTLGSRFGLRSIQTSPAYYERHGRVCFAKPSDFSCLLWEVWPGLVCEAFRLLLVGRSRSGFSSPDSDTDYTLVLADETITESSMYILQNHNYEELEFQALTGQKTNHQPPTTQQCQQNGSFWVKKTHFGSKWIISGSKRVILGWKGSFLVNKVHFESKRVNSSQKGSFQVKKGSIRVKKNHFGP